MASGLDVMTSSEFMRNYFYGDFVILYNGVKSQELHLFNEQITDWERQTFGKQV